MVGYIISLSTMDTAGRYFSLFLMASGYCGMYSLALLSTFHPCPSFARGRIAVRVHTDVGVGIQCRPSTTSQAVCSDRPRERLRKPREFVRGCVFFPTCVR